MQAQVELANTPLARAGLTVAWVTKLGWLTGIGLAGALPRLFGTGHDALALVCWLGLWAAPAGLWCAGWGFTESSLRPDLPRRARPTSMRLLSAAFPAVVWGLVLWSSDFWAVRPVPHPGSAALAVAGLFGGGLAVGLCGARSAAFRANLVAWGAALFVVCAGLAALPTRAGLPGQPWPPEWASLALDLSSVTYVAECAGVDWMRRPGVYDAAGTDRFLRAPHTGLGLAWFGLTVGVLTLAFAHKRDPAVSS